MKLRVTLFMLATLLAASESRAQGHFHLAAHYAPVIYQDVVCTEYGDYITRIDYDGDYVGINNWENLGYPTKARRLPAFVYYSVIETSTHYFITYALFHPADDFHCHFADHENDLEGVVLTVQKDSSTYGTLRLVQLQSHLDFYQYGTSGSGGIRERNEDTDGTIYVDQGSHPRVYVEGGGHGIRHRKKGGAPSVVYRYEGSAEDPDEAGYASTGYDLLSIFSEMWERRYNCCGSGHLFDKRGNYSGRRGFFVPKIGRKLDGDNGANDAANAPWNWSDNDDPWADGDWFMDPAGYQLWQFKWSESFSTNYTHHPFLYSQLPDEIYNGRGGTTTLRYGPYLIPRTVGVIQGQTLHVTPGCTIEISLGQGLRSLGKLRIEGGELPTRIRSRSGTVMTVSKGGAVLAQHGGGLRLR